MSIWYGLNIVINVPFSEKMIAAIIKRGEEESFKYLAREEHESISDVMKFLDESSAIQRVLTKPFDDLPSVDVRIDDTYITISFWESENNCNWSELYVSFACYMWKKKFRHWEYNGRRDIDDEYVDFARYINIFLRICRDFPVITIETSAI